MSRFLSTGSRRTISHEETSGSRTGASQPVVHGKLHEGIQSLHVPGLRGSQLSHHPVRFHQPLRYSASARRGRRANTAAATRAAKNAGTAVASGQTTKARSHESRIADVVNSE